MSRRSLPQRVAICGSMSFYSRMVDQKRELVDSGVRAILPDPDSDLLQAAEEEDYQEAKRRVSMRHIRRIRDQSTFAILVCNFDKHSIHNYVGANTFAEVAVAVAHYKPVYLLHGIPEFYRDELEAWRAVPLGGDLRRLIDDYASTVAAGSSQLRLFDL